MTDSTDRRALTVPDASDLQRYHTDQQLIAMSEVVLERGRLELAAFERIQDITDQRAKAKAIHKYIAETVTDRVAKLTAKNNLMELILREQRALGERLADMPLRTGGDATKARYQTGTEFPPRLADMNVTKKQSSTWQLQAQLPEDLFDAAWRGRRGPDRAMRLATYIIARRRR